MSLLGKFIVGGLGWAVGGPIGAIIGVLIASSFSSNTFQQNEAKSRTRENDFKISLLVLIAAVLKCDGTVKRSELDIVKQFLVKNFGEQEALEALQLLKEILQKDIDVPSVAAQIGMNMNYSSKLELLHLLFLIASADGIFHTNELSLISQVAAIFGISANDFNSVKAMFMKNSDSSWAYQVLEIEKSASDSDIKKAYRRMAMKYHPDKLSTLGEEIKQQAEEKFKKVHEAYQVIKKERNIN